MKRKAPYIQYANCTSLAYIDRNRQKLEKNKMEQNKKGAIRVSVLNFIPHLWNMTPSIFGHWTLHLWLMHSLKWTFFVFFPFSYFFIFFIFFDIWAWAMSYTIFPFCFLFLFALFIVYLPCTLFSFIYLFLCVLFFCINFEKRGADNEDMMMQ